MSKVIIGVDPGVNGGIAILTINSALVKKMPATAKDVYDLFSKFAKTNCICILEKIGGMPGNGGNAMFNFGKGYGHIEMALLALKIPTYTVTPQVWQKSFQLGSTKGKLTTTQWKNILKAKAQQVFPKLDVKLWGADALLIAEYGKQIYDK